MVAEPLADPDTAAPVMVQGLVKQFDNGRVKALDSVDLTLEPGQLVALLGRSGSGKSTLLRIINGLAEPTAGEVRTLGRDVPSLRPRELRQLRSEVGFVFQGFNLVGRLSALENVLIGAYGRLRLPRYGTLTYSRELREGAAQQLERVGLADQIFQRADTLSGGQQQRVAIARMLFQQPRLVLADEPVSALDPAISAQVLELLVNACREDGLSVLCSIHQADLALGWSDRMVGLKAGKKVLDRPASECTLDEIEEMYRS